MRVKRVDGSKSRGNARAQEVVSVGVYPDRIVVYSTPEAAAQLSEKLAALGLKTVIVRQSMCG
ncbi:MAG: hypothetical protein Q8P50_03150 [Bacillota bacterium]|jgi:hypothetical protein|nr:hypothetical protein [Bacillota bacterium]